jgi:hypothetical protein
MKFAGVSVGQTRKNKYKIFCLISRDGKTDSKKNQLRAISFKDQPRTGFNTLDEALDYAQSLPPDKLTEYVTNNRIPSRGVHVHQQEYQGKYDYAVLVFEEGSWSFPVDPQLEFEFVKALGS